LITQEDGRGLLEIRLKNPLRGVYKNRRLTKISTEYGSKEIYMKKQFAIFIDGDNISCSYYENILLMARSYGEIHETRVYADWTEPNMKSWKEKLLKNPAVEFQAFRFGANATDNRIIMDAVEMIFLNPAINAFCVVSTDSDYLFLAHRLRARGKYVLGIGGANAKKEWRDSCDTFLTLENGGSHSEADKPKHPKGDLYDERLTDRIVADGFDKAKATGKTDIDGWIIMADFAQIIEESYPGLWGQLGGNHRKTLEDYANATGKIDVDKSKPGKYRIRLQNASDAQTNNAALPGLEGILGYGFNQTKRDKHGWAYVANFWEAIKKHCPSFKNNPGFWKKYGSTVYEVLEEYEKKTGEIEIDKSRQGSWRVRQKPQEQTPDNSEIVAL
jgi:hypothetical protein